MALDLLYNQMEEYLDELIGRDLSVFGLISSDNYCPDYADIHCV